MSSMEELEQQMAVQIEEEQEGVTLESGKSKGNNETLTLENFQDDDDDDKSVADKKLHPWKLVMTRRVSAFTVRFNDSCGCARDLYTDKEKLTLHRKGSVTLRIKLCSTCVPMNIRANEAFAKFYKPKKAEASGW